MKEFIRKMTGANIYENSQSYKSLIDNLELAKYEISELDTSLDYITEPILMNQIIFQRKAAEMRYRYWLKLVKEKETLSD